MCKTCTFQGLLTVQSCYDKLMHGACYTDFERPASQEEGPQDQPSTSGTPRPSIYELIWHASDSSVKPIVANRRIERLPEPKWDAQALPFRPLVHNPSPPLDCHM